ncbi:flagellar hook-length control protein FliK [Marinobacter sp. M216]|uniref:Flagellar hook-length control protein FliK n=1 Tax=Marinobacter albus TaxID=3030833 RepID=A0ABT7HBI8_9GAMM|nr:MULTISPECIES: flagellar hook-length control protein FliK [unclassified Marinobacter]MBW7470338.1 flagellar hook-length control protein FliK [Marinobacter sp. F4218]MDK9557397.1 flagellar hook-length control protein FliK [Marinobacter sp. M216]
MKLPTGQQPPQPAGQTPISPARAATVNAAGADNPQPSARQQLDALQLANRQATLARVAEIINRQGQATSEVLLDVRGKSLLVEAAIGNTRLETGDWVKVMRAGNELQLMGKLAPAQETGIARALVQHMPWQQNLEGGLTKLLASLSQGLKPDPSPGQLPSARPSQPLPEAARQSIQQVLARLPASASLMPGSGRQEQPLQQIKQWIAESGLFAESRLVQTPSATLPDLKLAVGRVITALLTQQGNGPEHFNRLTPLASPELVQAPLNFPQASPRAPAQSANGEATTVGQMLRLLAGMLNRITVNQLHSQVLTARTGGDAPAPLSTLLLELPWVTPQNEPRVAQLRLEQYPEDRGTQEQQHKASVSEWRLSLAMDLDEAGPLHFDVALRQQSVSARVWAEKQSTLRQVNEELPLLRQSLTDLGLDVTDLECRRGTPQASATRLEHRLVDTRA